MKKILLAVDDTKGANAAFSFCSDICPGIRPEGVVLLFVERFEGKSLIAEMLGDAEASTLREALQGTEYNNTLPYKQGIVFFWTERGFTFIAGLI